MTNIEKTAETKPTNTMALIGFVLSLCGFVVGPLAAVAGIVLGHIGLNQIKKTGEQGHGLGVAALIMGYIQVALIALVLVVMIVITVFFGWAWWQHNLGMNYMDNA